jgi:hypothetical protein
MVSFRNFAKAPKKMILICAFCTGQKTGPFGSSHQISFSNRHTILFNGIISFVAVVVVVQGLYVYCRILLLLLIYYISFQNYLFNVDFDFVKLILHREPQIFSQTKYSVISDLRPIFPKRVLGTLKFNLHTKFHINKCK